MYVVALVAPPIAIYVLRGFWSAVGNLLMFALPALAIGMGLVGSSVTYNAGDRLMMLIICGALAFLAMFAPWVHALGAVKEREDTMHATIIVGLEAIYEAQRNTVRQIDTVAGLIGKAE
ncbi:MAG: hypothetical protein R2867_05380 [Caldilineaceae bacterium]